MFTKSYKVIAALCATAIAVPVLLVGSARASDHADTPEIAKNPGTDITDVYMFPSPSDPNNVVLVMNVHPLIASGSGETTTFDPNVLYQFKIDNNGDAVEDRVIQVKFSGNGAAQMAHVAGPVKPSITGSTSERMRPYPVTGLLNVPFSPTPGMKVFTGGREDPFFFDLEQFFNILPDRATPLTGQPVPDPNTPKQTSWRAPGQAVDFLSNGGYNVLSIVIELPKTMLTKAL